MIPLYRPGSSPLHRVPAGAKLMVVFILGIAISAFRGNVWVALAAWAIVLAGFLLSRKGFAGMGDLARQFWRLKWLVLLISIPQLIFLSPELAAINTARVVAVILLAGLFTLTTRVSDVLELLDRGLRPLERAGLGRIGLTADRISLAMALTMRSLPVVFGFYREIREARQARGAKTSLGGIVGMTTPLLVMSLKHAEETAEALAARGIR